MRIQFTILASLLLASACSTPPPPVAPKPPPVERPPVAAPKPAPAVDPTGHWLDWPIASGDWIYRQDERGSIALFGPVGQDATVTLRCDKARQRIYFSRQGNAAGAVQITMRSSSATRNWPASGTGGTVPYIAAEIMPNDRGLDDIAYTRGRIALEVPGTASIAVPIWAEVSRVIEDCRG